MTTLPVPSVRNSPRDERLAFVPCRPFGVDYFDAAPVRFDNHVELPISKDRLFEIFADPDSWSQWATGIAGVEWTSPAPFGVGTTRTVRFWGGVKVYEEFFKYDVEAGEMAFCFYGTTELVWTAFGEHYVVDSIGPNRCRLRWTVAYDPAGVFGRIHWLLRPIMTVNLWSYMVRLKRYVRRLEG